MRRKTKVKTITNADIYSSETLRRVLREERAHTFDTVAADKLIEEMEKENVTHKESLKVKRLKNSLENFQVIRKRFEEMPDAEYTDDKLADELAKEKVRHEAKLFKIRLAATKLSPSM